jgi:hypothetical protein
MSQDYQDLAWINDGLPLSFKFYFSGCVFSSRFIRLFLASFHVISMLFISSSVYQFTNAFIVLALSQSVKELFIAHITFFCGLLRLYISRAGRHNRRHSLHDLNGFRSNLWLTEKSGCWGNRIRLKLGSWSGIQVKWPTHFCSSLGVSIIERLYCRLVSRLLQQLVKLVLDSLGELWLRCRFVLVNA